MADGSILINTKIDQSGFNKGVNQLQQGFNRITNSLKNLAAAVGIAFGTAAIVSFSKSAVTAATDLTNAMTGLKSIMDGQGKSFSQAQEFINNYVADGLIPATNAITAYKNLASRGYSTEQIESTLEALKDASAFGRQASLTMGEAVQSATEGLKNENSILVDNAGVTKNVSVMWNDYAASIGTTAANLTKQQKIQAEVLGIMEETKFQMGDAAKIADSYSGQVLKLQYNFNNLKIAVGNALIPVLQAVLPHINAAITALTKLANIFAQVTTALFGKQVSTQSQIADTATDAADAQTELASATTKAAQAAKKALAPFDQLNILQSSNSSNSSGSSGGTGAAGATTSAISESGEIGGNISISPKMLTLISKIKTALQPTIDALGQLKTALQPLEDFAAQGLSDFYNSFLKPVGEWTFGEGLPRFIDIISNGLQKIKWKDIRKSLNDLWKALEPFAENIGEGILWFWENVLVPLGEWTANNIVPAYLDAVSSAIEALNSTVEAVKPAFEWLWDNFLEPLAKWTGGKITDALTIVKNAIADIADVISEKKDKITNILTGLEEIFNELLGPQIETAKNVVGVLFDIISTVFDHLGNLLSDFIDALSGLVDFIAGVFTGDWNRAWNGLKEFIKGITDGIQEYFDMCWDAIKAIFEPVADWLKGKFNDAWNGVKEDWSGAVEHFQNIWAEIKLVFSAAAGWFKSTFTEAWEAIKLVFSGVGDFFGGIWDTIKSKFTDIGTKIGDAVGGAFKSVINTILEFMEDKINGFIESINSAITTINKIPGVSIDKLDTVSIPKMARGGIVSAPTVAMIGEAGREAVLPLDNNTGWIDMLVGKLVTVLGMSSSQNSSIPEIHLVLDGQELNYKISRIQNLQAVKTNGR